VVKQVGERLVI